MELVVIVVFVSSLMLVSAEASAQYNLTTLDEFFLDQHQLHIHEVSLQLLQVYRNDEDRKWNSFFGPSILEETPLPLSEELFEYLRTLQTEIAIEFGTLLEIVTVQSIYKDLNGHCSEYLDTPIVNITEELRVRIEEFNRTNTCVKIQLGKALTLNMKKAIEVGLQKLSHQCIHKRLAFCSSVSANCTLAYEERIRQLMSTFIEDINNVVPADGETPLGIIEQYLVNNMVWVSQPFSTAYSFLSTMAYFISSRPSIEPFAFENLIRPWYHQALSAVFINEQNNTISQDDLTWGIVRSNTGTLDLPCSYYRHAFPENSEEFFNFLHRCYYKRMFQSSTNLIYCAYMNSSSRPLTWSSSVLSVYFHSQCLCLLSNGNHCRVKATEGINARFYCLSVLLRDFQRQVLYRPAVTYLDYALQTRVTVCQFSNLLQVAFKSECDYSEANRNLHFVLSVQCFFKDFVNKRLNCSETLVDTLLDTYNHTVLCNLEFFMELVLCDGDDEVLVPYYGAGDSALVLVLTYVDVVVRVFTLVTYLACPQLRNLPGKMLICYQATAMLRLLVVRASLEDLALAVRFDVATDLASTLWLTAYLHFLTVSIMTLRPPDSLRPDEARTVLLRYMLFGWALPALLSAAFFWMDEVVKSHVLFGQLLFVLCNYAALFANLYMSFKNCHFYYDVKSKARLLQQGVTARSVFAGLFNFAMKTSVLSGAGIIFRLVFTQIQGLEHLLGYYHVLGTLHGLLLFALYGCNREARVFWLSVVNSTLHRFLRRQNSS